ncbi:MAG: metal-dependent transcriptional regulator [Chloroflexaceae bacterium]|jgi:DtxR family Mn-dependent transcriptional regulator|nr:metal-dependent transcriptional regulator [Chloroflexaceae bacterium]
MEAVSESNEMYLLRAAMLQRNGQPVPLSLLAQELAVSPVSANEMCRKLNADGLLVYEPYKGVKLTAQGAAIARRVLRRRRLWEVFLVERLHLTPDEAEALACRFEHVTPDHVANRLSSLLGEPRFSPQHEPIPPADESAEVVPPAPLTTLSVGSQGVVAAVAGAPLVVDFLEGQGLRRGVLVAVLATAANGPVLLEVAGAPLALAHDIAKKVAVAPLANDER